MMTVSVVITTYNRSHAVCNAIASVLAQTHADFELLVVDDGSRDDTAARVRGFTDSRLRYVRQDNAGVAAARNRGAALARGEVLAFLDDDDVWMSDKSEADLDFLDRHPEVQAVFSDVRKYDGPVVVPSFTREAPVFGRLLYGRAYPQGIVLPERWMFLCLLQEVPILPSTVAIRRQAFHLAGGFDESWRSFEDWEFFIRLSRRIRWGYIDRALTVLRVSSDSLHRIASVQGRTALISYLLRERTALASDPEALAAIRRGIVHQRKTMGWHYGDAGRYAEAFANYLRGFREVGDPWLLIRAAIAWLPSRWKRRIRRSLAEGFGLVEMPQHAR